MRTTKVSSGLANRKSTKTLPLFAIIVQAVPAALFLLLQAKPGFNALLKAPLLHFQIVVITTVFAVILAVAVLRTALRLRHASTFLLGLGFLSMAGIFMVHGLATPGLILEPNLVVGVAAPVSLLTGAIFMAGSAWVPDTRLGHWISRRMPVLLVAWVLVLVAFGTLAMLRPQVVELLPFTRFTPSDSYAGTELDETAPPTPPAFWAESLVTVALYATTAAAYWRRSQKTGIPTAAALAISAVLFLEAQVAMFFEHVWRLDWWEYHILMLLGFLTGVGTILWELGRRRGLAQVIEGMYSLRDAVDLELQYTDTISVLAAATEAKDPLTQGHTLRVGHLAASIGQELGLPPSRIRVLARAGMLHDVGKLGVPDGVLNKPGRLTVEEFAQIKEHPTKGHEILRRVGDLEEEVRLILAHHERLDGSGYPAGLKGEQIPLEARILSVADVYDSLVMDRPYRKAMTQPEALAIIWDEAKSLLDPQCVVALRRIVERPTTP